MPTFNSPAYLLEYDGRVNLTRLAPRTSKKVEHKRVSYTLAGTEAGTDIINLGVVPVGSVLCPDLSNVTCADPGTTLTLDIGTADDPDGLADGINLSGGGRIECCSGTVPAYMAKTELAADSGKKYTKVYATVVSGNTLSAGVILYFDIAYIEQS